MKIKEKYFQNSGTFLIKILGNSNVKAFFCKKWFFVLKRLKLPTSKIEFLTSTKYRSSHPEVSLGKGVLKITALRHGCFAVNLLHIFRTSLL